MNKTIIEQLRAVLTECSEIIPFVDAHYHEHEMDAKWMHISPDGFASAVHQLYTIISSLGSGNHPRTENHSGAQESEAENAKPKGHSSGGEIAVWNESGRAVVPTSITVDADVVEKCAEAYREFYNKEVDRLNKLKKPPKGSLHAPKAEALVCAVLRAVPGIKLTGDL